MAFRFSTLMHKPLKKFGQNFLNQPAIAHKIIKALDVNTGDTILEIGPGPGILTQQIIELNPKQYYAVEVDNRWAEQLATQFGNRVDIINRDFLQYDLTKVCTGDVKPKIIGNIPYNITSPILFKLLDHFSEIDRAVIMMQKEVARRIVADSGNKEYGILSVLIQTCADVDYLFEVGRQNFSPAPKVDSAVLRFNFFDRISGINNPPLFRKIVRATFNYRRKMLRNSLSRIFDQTIVSSLSEYDLTKRPEQLELDDFKALANTIDTLQ